MMSEAQRRAREKAAAIVKVGKGTPHYACKDCIETFTAPVWHCPVCAHHWPDGRTECWNCHEYTRKRGANLADLIADNTDLFERLVREELSRPAAPRPSSLAELPTALKITADEAERLSLRRPK